MKLYFVLLSAYCGWAHATICSKAFDLETEMRRKLSFAPNVAREDRRDLEQFVDEAETIFDQGIRRVGLEFQHDLYWITRFESTQNPKAISDGPFFYRVEKLRRNFVVPQSIRLRQMLKSGGLSKLFFVKDRVLKDAALHFAVTELNEPIAVRMVDFARDRTYFSVFQDHAKKDKVLYREIYDVTYARRYTISRALRAHLHFNKQVSLTDIDQAFANWNGNDRPDVFVDKKGVIIPRPPPDPGKTVTDGVFRWFLSRDSTGEILRVVIIRRPSRRLPEIVTAYRPSPEELTLLSQFK